jgi:hypothetical protein
MRQSAPLALTLSQSNTANHIRDESHTTLLPRKTQVPSSSFSIQLQKPRALRLDTPACHPVALKVPLISARKPQIVAMVRHAQPAASFGVCCMDAQFGDGDKCLL